MLVAPPTRRASTAAAVAQAEAAIAQMTVRATRAGTVVYVANRQGVKKKVGDSCWRMEKVIEIPDLTRMRGEGEVDEADAGRVAPGQRVTLHLDAHPERVFTGIVRDIRGAVEARADASPEKVVRLILAVDRTDPQRMRPGMRFRGEIDTERVRQAVVVPLGSGLNPSPARATARP